jgi:hypothetical protein
MGTALTVLMTILTAWVLVEIQQMRKQAPVEEIELPREKSMDNNDNTLKNLSNRITELGEKSTQVLIFLSFALVVVATLGTNIETLDFLRRPRSPSQCGGR